MNPYNRAVNKIQDVHDSAVEGADQRRPGVTTQAVRDGAWLSGLIISLGERYRRHYDQYEDEEYAQKRFNAKMSRITENARYEQVTR